MPRVDRIARAGQLSCFITALLLALTAPHSGWADPRRGPEVALPAAESVLRKAFQNQYDVDITARIELVMRDATGRERRRRFEAVSKMIDNRLHTIGRLTYPEYLRGMTILQIEAADRGHDAFVYLPSLRKVRRISTSQRGDPFFGTDITYEDLERRRPEDYEVVELGVESFADESVFVVQAHPVRDSTYTKVIFYVAQLDWAILEARYYKRESNQPFRRLSAPRAAMITVDGHVLPTHVLVTNSSRRTTTEVTFEDLKINPPIDDRIFSVRVLEQERSLEQTNRARDERAGGTPPDQSR